MSNHEKIKGLTRKNGRAYTESVKRPVEGAAFGAASTAPGTANFPRPDNPTTKEVSPEPEMIRLLDAYGVFLRLVDAREGRLMIRNRAAVGLGSRRRIRAIQLVAVTEIAPVESNHASRSRLLPNGLVGQRYSHKRENEKNPPEVWMLRKLSSPDPESELHIRSCYISSLTDCMAAGVRREFMDGIARDLGLRRKRI